MSVMKELVETIGVEGLAAMGYKPDGTRTVGFEQGLQENVAGTMGRESAPRDQSALVQGRAIIAALREAIGPNTDITRAHIDNFVKSRHGIRLDLVEAACTVVKQERAALAAGTKPTLVEANPYHDPDSGEFTSDRAIVGKKKGSFSLGGYGKGKSKSRVGKRGAKIGKGKDGRVRALINWVSASRPCGRDARKQGKDIKCSTGKRAGATESTCTPVLVDREPLFESTQAPVGRWVKR